MKTLVAICLWLCVNSVFGSEILLHFEDSFNINEDAVYTLRVGTALTGMDSYFSVNLGPLNVPVIANLEQDDDDLEHFVDNIRKNIPVVLNVNESPYSSPYTIDPGIVSLDQYRITLIDYSLQEDSHPGLAYLLVAVDVIGTKVPEPSSFILMCLGFPFLFRRKRFYG